MAVSFPTSPSTGDTFDVGRIRYEWSGSAWKQIASQPVSTGAEIPFTKADGSTSDPIKLASSVIGDALVNDTTPQLGGDLDVNGNSIVSTSNANINITPNGSGKIVLDGISWPNADGSANYVLKTNGSGVLSWAADAAGTITALNNATENELVTVGATTTELDGEANLTFNGSTLSVTGGVTASGVGTFGSVSTSGALSAGSATINSVDVVTSHGPYGSGASGAVSNITDADFNATTVAQSGTVTLTSNRIIRATSTVTLSQAITVNKQDGQVRGSYPAEHGSPGIELGAILAALGSKGIPIPIRPGGGSTALCGGIVQIIAGGNVSVGATITASGTNASSDGGGGGGLVVIISGGTISGSSAITVEGSDGHATAGAEGGAGGYAGEPGGHAGYGGSGGGALACGWPGPGSGGAGFKAGGSGTHHAGGGGGGGSLDNGGSSGSGGNGDNILASYSRELLGGLGSRSSVASSNGPGNASGGGGTNGGGGDGGHAGGYETGGNATDGAGGGGGGGSGCSYGRNGGSGGDGGQLLYALSARNVYAGLPGGQGGGGGGGGYGGGGGSGGNGASAVTHALLGIADSYGTGAGGAGANGSSAGTAGAAGGKGGNGGGAAGLCLMIAPTITYSGTVTGRHIKITGTDAEQFIRGLLTYG